MPSVGDFIDPYTGRAIPEGAAFDYSHVPGFEWRTTKRRARDEDWTHEQVIEYENDPSHHQIEDPSANRGPGYEGDPHETPEVDVFGRTELHHAALEDDPARVGDAIAAGAAVGLGDHERLTPLHFAAQRHSVTAARELIAAGAEVDARDLDGNTPLFRAVFGSRGSTDMIALLREHGADATLENRHGRSPHGLAKLMGAEQELFPDL